MVDRKIVITDCSQCPHVDHKGAFGNPAYAPFCYLSGKDLPYETDMQDVKHVGSLRMVAPKATVKPGIPDHCPLEKNDG